MIVIVLYVVGSKELFQDFQFGSGQSVTSRSFGVRYAVLMLVWCLVV